MREEPNKDLVNELIKNNISLEKASLALLDSVTKLTDRTDRLLSLFEEAAKNIEKLEVKEPITRQLEELLEQNKTIARGLLLIEKYIREKTSVGLKEDLSPKPLPRLS